MIITRTPFRVSFLGGGTDIPWFYRQKRGAVISTAISKYMYLSVHDLYDKDKILIKYSKTEFVSRADQIVHPIAREIFTKMGIQGVDLSVTADIPAGSGLGSSSAFTVGLVHLMESYLGRWKSKEYLANLACDVEINQLGEPIGKQDQYASAFGGVNFLQFNSDDSVEVKPLNFGAEAQKWLNECMVLVRVGQGSRSASVILADQKRFASADVSRFQALSDLAELTFDAVNDIKDDPRKLASHVNEAWNLKIKANPEAFTQDVHDLVHFGLSRGAYAAKMLGAGGSGFILFMVEPELVEKFISDFGSESLMRIATDELGSTVIYAK